MKRPLRTARKCQEQVRGQTYHSHDVDDYYKERVHSETFSGGADAGVRVGAGAVQAQGAGRASV
jgi:hypothetical protein